MALLLLNVGPLAHECTLCANFSLETDEGERRRQFDALVFGRQLRHASRGVGAYTPFLLHVCSRTCILNMAYLLNMGVC